MANENEKAPILRRYRSARQPARRVTNLKKLKLLVLVVNRNKAEFYQDTLLPFEVNMQMLMHAEGTAPTEAIGLLGLTERDKAVLFCLIREDRASAALRMLEEKFATVRGGKGVAYTVPLSGVMGAAIYSFLANAKEAAPKEGDTARRGKENKHGLSV